MRKNEEMDSTVEENTFIFLLVHLILTTWHRNKAECLSGLVRSRKSYITMYDDALDAARIRRPYE